MECMAVMIGAAIIAWLMTKSNCVGNVFGCLLFIVLCAALASVIGVGM
jgi:hypothetical protein